jgi:hypothetical protein
MALDKACKPRLDMQLFHIPTETLVTPFVLAWPFFFRHGGAAEQIQQSG